MPRGILVWIAGVLKIVFCFPYRGVGGVSLLFLRLARALATRGGVEPYLVDYTDGFMARHADAGMVRVIEYSDTRKTVIPDGAVTVFQSRTPWSLYRGLRLPDNARLLFWTCHPFNLVPTLPGFRRPMRGNVTIARAVLASVLRHYRSRAVRFVRFLLERNSLVFMDAGSVTTTERYLGIEIEKPIYLPIPARGHVNPVPHRSRDFQAVGLRVAWVGRVVDFKYYILKLALVELDRAQPRMGFRISVAIIGSGDHLDRLRADAGGLGNISMIFIPYLSPDMLDDYLREEVDVLIAMGTSALEGAKFGIPTILLDVCYGEVPEGYVFQWLHNRTGFSLGDVIDAGHLKPGNHSLIDRLREVTQDYSSTSLRAAEYFRKNHDIEAVVSNLLRLTDLARCTYGELADAGLLTRGVLYSAFAMLRGKFDRT